MKNIQIIDGAVNATFSVFQATDEEFAAIFPDGCDIELVEGLIERMGEEAAGSVLTPLLGSPDPQARRARDPWHLVLR
nr:hypothetical protein [uncultured Sphingomonas sp.]